MKSEKYVAPRFSKVEDAIRYALEKLIEQGGRSVTENGTCRYRTSDGKKCLVGWLIDDDQYNGFWEGRTAAELGDEIPQFKRGWLGLLDWAQSFHDNGDAAGLLAGRIGDEELVQKAFEVLHPDGWTEW